MWQRIVACVLVFALLAGIAAAQSTDTPRPPPVSSDEDFGRVGYAHITGVINRMRHRYLARVLDDAKAQELDTIIVHIDTDGGEVFAAREMLKLLLETKRDELRTIAFVDFRAISAGAMIAYGHDAIYLSETASIGDIGVVFMTPDGGMKYAPEKVETVVRTLLTQAAEQRGWSKGLLLKMIARNQKLYRITLPENDVVYVIEDDMPDFLSSYPDVDADDNQQVIVYRGEDRLLTLTGREALELGMASGLASDIDSLYAKLGINVEQIVDLGPTASESTAWYLAGVAPLLAGLALMFIFFELKTPGVGLFALLAAGTGALFLMAQYYLDMANNMEMVLMALGMLLVVIEFLTMAGGGLLAGLGALIMFCGLVMAFLPNEFEFDPGDEQYLEALGGAALSTLGALGVAAIGVLSFIAILPRTRLAGRVAMEAEVSATSAGELERSAPDLVGRQGRARDRLRPSGIVVVGGDEYSARAEHGAFVDAGSPVEVIAVELGELVVRAHPSLEST